MAAETIDPALARLLESRPDQTFDLLVRVHQIDDQVQGQIEAAGAKVRLRLTLVPTYAVTCSGAGAVGLSRLAAVQRVELDGPVYAL